MGGKVSTGGPAQKTLLPTDGKKRPPTHTVGPKQTLSAIAAQYGITVQELIAANEDIFDASKLGMTEGRWYSSRDIGGGKQDPDYVRPGQKLKLPPAKPAAGKGVGPSKTEAKAPKEQPEDKVEGQRPHGSTEEESTRAKQDREALSPENVDSKKGPDKAQPPPNKKKGGVFQMLAKIFSHPLFQGALAILSAIPGIGEVVSGIAGVLSLGVFLVGAMNARDGPSHANWITLGSALLYLAGAFIPGIGAFGGLVGMAQGDMPKMGEKPQGGGVGKKPQNSQVEDEQEAGRPVTDPLEAGSYDQHMAAAHELASMDRDPKAFDTWLTYAGSPPPRSGGR
jgi:LysM repeat protein